MATTTNILYLWYDQSGVLKNSKIYGSYPRSGTTDFSIFAHFEGVNISDLAYNQATIQLQRPDMRGSIYPIFYMDRKYGVSHAFPYLGDNVTDGDTDYWRAGQSYEGFLFDFSSFTAAEDLAILLNCPGLWRGSIALYDAGHHLNVTGELTFSVAASTVVIDEDDDDYWTLVLSNIALALAAKLNINSPRYIKVENYSDPDNVVVDAETFNVGDIIFNTYNDRFYQVAADFSLIVLSEAINDLVTLSTNQTITGAKIFNSDVYVAKEHSLHLESPSATVNTELKVGSIINHTGYADATFVYPNKVTGTYTLATNVDLDSRVAKVTSSTGYAQVYAKTAGGNQTMIDIVDTASVGGTIPIRQSNGFIYAGNVGADFGDSDAINKDYVDRINHQKVIKKTVRTSTNVKFPKGVLPLRIKATITGSVVLAYFDYNTGYLIDNIGRQYELPTHPQITISLNDGCVQLNYTGSAVGTITEIDFAYFNGDYDKLNTYYMYNPVTSSGTQLYEHKLSGTATTYDNESIEFNNFIIYSTSNTQITTTTLFNTIIGNAISIAPKPYSLMCDGNVSILVSYSAAYGIITYNLDAYPYALKTYAPLQDMGTVVDTVTEL